MTARVVADDDAGRLEAIATLRAGGVVALPTDTVYGIAVALQTPGGIERLYRIKRRPPDKGIALLIAYPAQAADIAVVTPAAVALGAGCWPGGLTVVLGRRPDDGLPDVLTGGSPTIGLRVPDHDAPRALARAVGPLPTTSANISGLPEARDAAEIVGQLGEGGVGPAHGGPASTVVDCSGGPPRIIRDGAVPATRIAALLTDAGISHDIRAG